MFRRIVIPTDFSTASEWAFDEAVCIAAASGAELVILHVRMTKPSDPGELRFPFDPSLYDYAEQQELQRLRHRVRDAGVEVTTRLIVRRAPDPASEIGRTVRDEGADLVVMATHASHHVAHLLIGSTTHALLQSPPAPLLVIRYGTRKRQVLSHVVVPVHDSGEPGPALALAAKIASEIDVILASATDSAKEAILRFVPHAAVHVIRGAHPDEEIVRHASKVDADAIFLDASGAPDQARLEIIRHAPMPVMVVPGNAEP